MSDYGLSVTLTTDYANALARTRAALAEQGFGVLTEIDVAATMKAKLDVDLDPWLILGACNAPLAYRALKVEPSVGLLLPCNVVVRALNDQHTLVEAMDPRVMDRVTGNPKLTESPARPARSSPPPSRPSPRPSRRHDRTPAGPPPWAGPPPQHRSGRPCMTEHDGEQGDDPVIRSRQPGCSC